MSPARINTTGWQPTYYRVRTLEQGRRICIDNVHVPRGTSIFIPRGWDHGMNEGMRPELIDRSGDIFFINGRFSPVNEGRDLPNYKGQMIGQVMSYDAEGNASIVGHIPLSNYIVSQRDKHLQAIVEMFPSPTTNKLSVIERRMETNGLMEDRSKFVYTLTQAGTKLLQQHIPNYRWITDVRVSENKVDVYYELPGQPGAIKHLEMSAVCFKDNEGNHLLRNRKANMSRVKDFYQSGAYTDETKRFRPAIDEMHGQLRLIVHKVRRYEIDLPEGVTVPQGGNIKVFPAAADAAFKVNDRWVPLGLKEPLFDKVQPESLRRPEINEVRPEVKADMSVDLELSQVHEGEIKSAIGPQTRFGEANNISSEYVRDPYFYGLTIEALFSTVEKYGENFAINRAKAVRTKRAIQSGRTHVMEFKMLFNEFADILPTNNPYLKKLSNFAEEVWGPGVSEDTQMEMAYWLKGVKMWAVKEMVALMAAEKEWGRYNTQNTQRYNYSEVLFNLSFLLSKVDVLEGRLFGKLPVLMSWQEMSEIAAGRTWYKMPHAKITEMLAIPSYLLSFGHVLFYPVDLVYFIGAWLGRTVASSINYTRHLISLGYNFLTGFWKNPAAELTMLGGYARAAWKQFLERPQYGTFMMTVGGSGELIPPANRKLIWTFVGTTSISIAATAVALTLGGLVSWLALPLGIAAIPAGISLLAKGMGQHRGWRKFVRAATGVTLAAAGGAAALVGIPIMLANPLSIAVIANVAFGIYSLGLLGRAIADIRRATREDEMLKLEKAGKPTNKQTLNDQQKQVLERIQTFIRQGKQNLTYEQLHAMREELRQILLDIGAVDKKGRRQAGIEHPYRYEIFTIMDSYADIEATIAKKACGDLVENINTQTAREALLDILRTSREYIVVDFAAKTYRRFGFKLD